MSATAVAIAEHAIEHRRQSGPVDPRATTRTTSSDEGGSSAAPPAVTEASSELVVALSHAQRECFYGVIHWWLTGDEQPIGRQRWEALAYQARVAELIRLWDELGWDDAAEARDAYRVTFGPYLRAQVVYLRDDLRQAAANERASREKARAGDTDHWYCDTDTLEQTLAKFDEQIESYDREFALLDWLVTQFRAAGHVLLLPEDLDRAHQEVERRRGKQMGVDFCTGCSAFPGEGEGLIGEFCVRCHGRSVRFDVGARHAAASAFGSALAVLRDWFDESEVAEILAEAAGTHGDNIFRDGHTFSFEDDDRDLAGLGRVEREHEMAAELVVTGWTKRLGGEPARS